MDRIAQIQSKDGIFEFVKTERQIFSNNLVLIDSLLPQILSQIVFEFYSSEFSHLTDLVNLTAKKNPLEFDIENEHKFYEYKIKRFLTDVALGMMPSQVWTGNYDTSNNPIYALGQPATIGDNNWCAVCPFDVDKGGVHINSGVQNRWFQILTTGSTAQNVIGIGMTDAARISYLALTSILLNSSEYADSRDATIEAARIIFGECSQQHRSTADAWTAVGILSGTNCNGLSLTEINSSQILIYPNPTSSTIQISLPQISSSPIKIFDLKGKVVHEFENSELNFQTDISTLDAGVYLMKFTFGEQQFVKRIIVQK